MEITIVDDSQANLEFSDLELIVIHNIFTAVKADLNHEPEFHARVGFYYSEAAQLLTSLSSNCIIDREQAALLSNILNEVCNGIKIEDFDTAIGIPKVEAKSYLRLFSKLTDKLHLLIEPYFRYNLSPMSKANLNLQQKFHTVGLRAGIRMDIK